MIAIEWRSVPWAPVFEVSSLGEVRKRINATHPERRQLMLMRLQVDKDGYLYLRLSGKKWLAHRLVFAIFCAPLVPGLVVCHRDGNKRNNSPGNLLQATQRENISHKLTHGTWQCGEKHGNATHTDEAIAQIKAQIAKVARTSTGRIKRSEGRRLARECGVSRSLITSLAHGRSWRHI